MMSPSSMMQVVAFDLRVTCALLKTIPFFFGGAGHTLIRAGPTLWLIEIGLLCFVTEDVFFSSFSPMSRSASFSGLAYV